MVNKNTKFYARQHNRKKKGLGLVAGVIIAGTIFISTTGQKVLAEEIATVQPIDTSTVASVDDSSVPTTRSVVEETLAEDVSGSDVSANANVSASVSNSGDGKSSIYTTVDVTTELTGDVKSGDYIDYTFENITVKSLDNKDIVTADNQVIGTFSLLSSSSAYDKQVYGSKTTKESLESQAGSSVLRATFNDNVNNLTNIVYSISNAESQTVTIVSDDQIVEQTVTVAGNEVGSGQFTNTATNQTNISKTKLKILSDNDVISEDGELIEQELNLGLESTNEQPLQVGDLLKLTFGDNSTISFNETAISELVGQTLPFYMTRGYFEGMSSNVNDVVLYDNVEPLLMKVISVTDRELVLESLSVSSSDKSFTAVLKNGFELDIRTDETIDVNANLVRGIDYDFELLRDNSLVDSSSVEDAELKIYGARVDATALNKKGTVRIEYRDLATGNIIFASAFVVNDVNVGTDYLVDDYLKNEVIWANGRYWKDSGDFSGNKSGKVLDGIYTVVQYFEEVKSSVFEDNFIEGTTTKLTDTVTVVSKASVGSAYDSSAQEEVITLADGKSYKLVSKATNSTGKVAEMDIYLANYYSEIKGSVVVKYVDTAGNTISEDVVDTKDSSTGVSYDTTDNKPTMILVKNADDTVTAYTFKEISDKTSAETGKVVAGETVVTYVYEEVTIVPVKDVLNKDGESVDGGKATVGDVLTFVLDGSPISDGIQGGLWQYDLKDVLDTAKVEYIDGSVKVYAGEFSNITLPDGSVLKADDDISSYVTIEFEDGVLTIKPTEELYTILKDNGVEDLVDIDSKFQVTVIADGTIENTLIQIVNGFEFKSNTTTTEAEVPVVETPDEPKADEPVTEAEAPFVEESKQSEATLPNTGTEKSYALSVMGVIALFGSLLGLRKKKESE